LLWPPTTMGTLPWVGRGREMAFENET
jgi:hypothetical protein